MGRLHPTITPPGSPWQEDMFHSRPSPPEEQQRPINLTATPCTWHGQWCFIHAALHQLVTGFVCSLYWAKSRLEHDTISASAFSFVGFHLFPWNLLGA